MAKDWPCSFENNISNMKEETTLSNFKKII